MLTASQRPTDVLLWEGELQRDNQTPPRAIDLKEVKLVIDRQDPGTHRELPVKDKTSKSTFFFFSLNDSDLKN